MIYHTWLSSQWKKHQLILSLEAFQELQAHPLTSEMPAYCWTIAQGFALSQLGQGLLIHPRERLSGTEPAWLFAVWESLGECSIYRNFSFVVQALMCSFLKMTMTGIIAINLKKGIFAFLFFPSFPKYLWIYSEILPLPRNFALLKQFAVSIVTADVKGYDHQGAARKGIS